MPKRINPLRKAFRRLRSYANHRHDKAFLEWEIRHAERLSVFENRHAGEHCFIIGNGPSLAKMDLSPLRNHVCFGLNKIYLHPQAQDIEIDYHVAVNKLVIEQGFERFKSLGAISFLSYRACWELGLKSPDYYYLMTGGPISFSQNPYGLINEGNTVTFVAMQMAYFMGFKTVYLIGVDHSFVANGAPHEQQHMEGPDPNHFHPDYFSGMDWHLPDLEGSEAAYVLARYYYRRFGRVIWDATLDGKLQIFPKIGFKEALSLSSHNSSSRRRTL